MNACSGWMGQSTTSLCKQEIYVLFLAGQQPIKNTNRQHNFCSAEMFSLREVLMHLRMFCFSTSHELNIILVWMQAKNKNFRAWRSRVSGASQLFRFYIFRWLLHLEVCSRLPSALLPSKGLLWKKKAVFSFVLDSYPFYKHVIALANCIKCNWYSRAPRRANTYFFKQTTPVANSTSKKETQKM